MRNNDIRVYAQMNGVRLWEVAEKLKMTDSSLSRWLRREQTAENKLKFKKAVDAVAAEQE